MNFCGNALTERLSFKRICVSLKIMPDKKGVFLMVTSGLPFSGKTEVARYLSQAHHFARLNKDETRTCMFGRNFPELSHYGEFLVTASLMAGRNTLLQYA